VLIVGLGGPVLAQPAPAGPAPSSAPYLGEAKYTVHLAGSLKNVLDDLGKIVGRLIFLPPQNGGGNGEPSKGDVMVKLDFDDATLDQMLLSVCKQAGVVYDAPAGGSSNDLRMPISLRMGDPQVDPRPTTQVGDYVVRVTSVFVHIARGRRLNWGQAAPEKPEVQAETIVGLGITAQTRDAAEKLAGIGGHYLATPDQGAPLEYGAGNVPGYFYAISNVPNAIDRTATTQLTLPAPAPEATKLVRLEGTLVLYSTVKVTEMKITPDAVGQTFQQDDVTLTEKSWKVEGQQLTVELEGKVPALPRKPGIISGYNRQTQTAVLVAKDGREITGAGGYGSYGGSNQEYRLSFMLDTPAAGHAPGAGGPAGAPGPFVADYLRLTFVREGDADVTVPFVIENIPLP
jgi:hypothetical protein